MRLYCIVHKMHGEENPWLSDAWDEDSVDDNYEGWKEAVDEALVEAGTDAEVRVGILEVPDDWMDSLFKPSVTQATPSPSGRGSYE